MNQNEHNTKWFQSIVNATFDQDNSCYDVSHLYHLPKDDIGNLTAEPWRLNRNTRGACSQWLCKCNCDTVKCRRYFHKKGCKKCSELLKIANEDVELVWNVLVAFAFGSKNLIDATK